VLWLTAVGCREIDDRRHHREEAAGRGPAHDAARRRQCAARLNRDLGFTDADRVENPRVGEVARLMTEAGLMVICSFICCSAPSAGWCGS
jgi:hypothetical protein